MVEMIRLQKFLADSGLASRRRAEQFILDGLVEVNGEIIKKMGVKIDPEKDEVKFRGEIVKAKKKDESIVVMLNKPAGYTCTTRRFKGEKNVLDLVKEDERLYPVGRLDKNSEGLLILTNDGELANKLMHPRYQKEKEYLIEVDQDIRDEDIRILRDGVELEDGFVVPIKVEKHKSKQMLITLAEGKKRQIRRMCQAIGLKVVFLKRIRINKLTLEGLKKGKYKILDKKEIERLG